MLAARAVEAAQAQMTALRGEDLGAEFVARPAHSVAAHNDEVTELDARVEARFRQHRDTEVIPTLPGMGPTTGAEFIAVTGGNLIAFASPDRLAAFAGLAPVPWDSGEVSGNLRRPRRLPPRPSTHPLPGRPGQRVLLPGFEGVLLPEEEGGQRAQASCPRPHVPVRQRAVGHDSRPDSLLECPVPRLGRLTSPASGKIGTEAGGLNRLALSTATGSGSISVEL